MLCDAQSSQLIVKCTLPSQILTLLTFLHKKDSFFFNLKQWLLRATRLNLRKCSLEKMISTFVKAFFIRSFQGDDTRHAM